MDTDSTSSNLSKSSNASDSSPKGPVPTTDWLLTHFAQFEKGLNGGAKLPLHSKRKQALTNYQKLGFPNSSQEEWKYTNPAPIQSRAFPLILNSKVESQNFDLYFTKGIETAKIVVLNGQIISKPACPAGLSITTLKETQADKGEMAAIVETHLACHAQSDEAFVAMNTSLIENALIIHLQADSKLNCPIEILWLSDQSASEKTILPRLLVVADKSSEAVIIERCLCTSDMQEYSINSVVEFALAENANISHYRVQTESIESFSVSTIAATLESNANFSTHTFSFGGKLVRNNVNIVMSGSNCNVVMNGLTAVSGKQHVDNHTLLDNTKPHCESNELYKGIYAGSSQGVFSGTIIVRQDAQKTNAIQSNRSLLLSDQAIVNTKPQLKIWADDVKCTHGATIGQLDDDAMFYLRSRGVSLADAKVMLVHAFASEVISAVKIEALRENLQALLLEKLELA